MYLCKVFGSVGDSVLRIAAEEPSGQRIHLACSQVVQPEVAVEALATVHVDVRSRPR